MTCRGRAPLQEPLSSLPVRLLDLTAASVPASAQTCTRRRCATCWPSCRSGTSRGRASAALRRCTRPLSCASCTAWARGWGAWLGRLHRPPGVVLDSRLWSRVSWPTPYQCASWEPCSLMWCIMAAMLTHVVHNGIATHRCALHLRQSPHLLSSTSISSRPG